MSSFSPEIAAHALMPKDLLSQASSMHFAMHLSPTYVEAVLAEAAGGEFHWARSFRIEAGHQTEKDMVAFVNDRNWNERVFRKCTISYDVLKFCLVPAAFFNPESALNMLEFNCGKVDQGFSHIEMREFDAVLVHEVPTWLGVITHKFPNGRFFPSAYLFLKHAKTIAERDGHSMMIYQDGSMMMLCVFHSRKLLLANAYPIQNEEDILYYASNAAMRLNFDFEHVYLRIYSHTKDLSGLNLLGQYNRHCDLVFGDQDLQSPEASFISHLHILCA